MITGNKIFHFYDRINGDKRPITADIYLTDFCNNSCAYCRFGKRTGRGMDLQTFERVYERLLELGVRGFILTGGGEPTINPDFDKITKFLEGENARYGINTNFNVYREMKPTFVKISIDEGGSAEYREMRGVDALWKVTENIKRYRKFLERENAATKVGIQCVTRSVEQAVRFYGYVCRELWDFVDYIQFRPIERVWKNIDYEEILQFVENLTKNDTKVTRSIKYDFVKFSPPECLANWAAITVDVDGTVHYCCNRPDLKVGSIFDEDILKKKAGIRPDMSKCEKPCRLTGPNVSLYNFHDDREIFFI